MLQYSTYSVISPEGCASILWKSADKAQLAAEAMAITSERLKEQGLVDLVIPEPLGGAHRDPNAMALTLKKVFSEQLDELKEIDLDTLIAERYTRLMGYGKFKE
jgi:acetyl-CoA carboxylase carboxyl transferase subunit alpha